MYCFNNDVIITTENELKLGGLYNTVSVYGSQRIALQDKLSGDSGASHAVLMAAATVSLFVRLSVRAGVWVARLLEDAATCEGERGDNNKLLTWRHGPS